MRIILTLFAGLLLVSPVHAQELESNPGDATLKAFLPLKAPIHSKLLLKPGDRLAICGDSITEQKMYSRLMEDYLTMCVPELEVTVRQYGWSGERAPGFLARMTNDCLRFHPTVATTCYGMNDHEYRPYASRIGRTYAQYTFAIDDAFKAHGVRVIQGSGGCVGKMPSWVKSASGTVEDLNVNLCTLRNIGLEVAGEEGVRFADVFWPMMTAGVEAQKRYGAEYAIAGKDGVHPGWAGQTVMAYAFLKAMGLDGEIGTFRADLGRGRMKASSGHQVVGAGNGVFEIRSARYPFCVVAGSEDESKDDSIRSAMRLIPFNKQLNRFMLYAKGASAGSYQVTWGKESRTISAGDLESGVNLADLFPVNPFTPAFAKVDAAVAAKQAYETKQIKEIFHGAEGKADMEKAVARTEQERTPLAKAIRESFVPVTHTIRIEPR